jgi:hypothetical protein
MKPTVTNRSSSHLVTSRSSSETCQYGHRFPSPSRFLDFFHLSHQHLDITLLILARLEWFGAGSPLVFSSNSSHCQWQNCAVQCRRQVDCTTHLRCWHLKDGVRFAPGSLAGKYFVLPSSRNSVPASHHVFTRASTSYSRSSIGPTSSAKSRGLALLTTP